ncbi:PepSY-associated TM helix domain-containing protein [Undibacterium fentianense]|uniref:PepSY-associated TM helix domain-containing protein n=1 Tax=Undibacterium fentianense TaxID=2828728 RepID=UPI002E37F45C|nr:PepSY-associated TM helix domain-containing protein [Undibacterium fentianense]
MSHHPQQRRAFWLRHLHNWHWISSAICLIAMILFALTGFTLNHAGDIEAHPVTHKKTGQVPSNLREQMLQLVQKKSAKTADPTLPLEVQTWLEQNHKIDVQGKPAEWSPEEIYVALPRPGGDAWLRIALEDGTLEYELTQRGLIAYLNDLHKGRNTGKAWSWFIDLFALACLIFCVTGLFLLKMHANNRVLTWPLVVLGTLAPLLLAVLFIH